jgi:hypothetical protein
MLKFTTRQARRDFSSKLLGAAIGAVLATLCAATALAQTYPSTNVRLLTPYPSRSTAEVKSFIERESQIFKVIQRETGVKVQ